MNLFALVDCNNFFVSCERIFNPKLHNVPVVVLSSNDACIIARSNEAKKLGIPMGAALYEYQALIKKNNVRVYSSNFALYGDMSACVMQFLSDHATECEIYSVDEAFIFIPPFHPNVTCQNQKDFPALFAKYLRTEIKKSLGLPVSIGIGPTKTLAKIANTIAKKRTDGVFDITDHPGTAHILNSFKASDIWGIGSRSAKKLAARGIHSALDFKNADARWVRKNLTVKGEETLLELRGISCVNLETMPDPKQSITVSRLFGKPISDLHELKQALGTYVSLAAEKMRKQELSARMIMIFTTHIAYHDSTRHYTYSHCQLPIATDYTPDLLNAAMQALERIFTKGYIYKKVGVILDDLVHKNAIQLNPFFQHPIDAQKQLVLMSTVDTINRKMGRNTIQYAVSGTDKQWTNKQEKKSAAYTTNWHELLTIKI